LGRKIENAKKKKKSAKKTHLHKGCSCYINFTGTSRYKLFMCDILIGFFSRSFRRNSEILEDFMYDIDGWLFHFNRNSLGIKCGEAWSLIEKEWGN
jgi:hypothetical protein